MKIVSSIQEFSTSAGTVVTLGTFDGVHIGHQSILDKVISSSKKLGCESLVLTFFPHPRMVLQHDSEIKLLNTIEEKSLLLEKAGIDNLVIHPFDQTFSQLTAEEFVKDILVNRFRVKKIIIGHDHRFGKNRTATIDDLIRFGMEYGFEVEQISAQEVDAVSVSSTKVRTALDEGNVALASQYLGYDYFFSGTVAEGRKLGRTIGYPTANIKIDESYKLIPRNGVYIVSSEIGGEKVYGMMNIGINPTVGGTAQSIEVYFFDFDQDLYGKRITVTVYEKIRDEQKFASVDELRMQLGKDQDVSFKYIANRFS
ncbi:riboflavin kinase / FMN adenylyltransferase [Flavobacterium enshiense DK69]|uniref:Riboflavin biosynthesis protein n=1 Tax=Flavobacterium enshiense DK69 TaxID=1107311 RepID=V6SAS0_9FLAO|nr:bifunctional riboflavin kinase/FAD synthetase [Flavobacterium enshiense]ESU23716.1 riboflavin kinase / FMN adenylyltransferase [Flavobacterium enshiense DK69]KGO96154.1 riboflavin biosynthesis protein RibF [Flavobacterium enshiense DK69]